MFRLKSVYHNKCHTNLRKYSEFVSCETKLTLLLVAESRVCYQSWSSGAPVYAVTQSKQNPRCVPIPETVCSTEFFRWQAAGSTCRRCAVFTSRLPFRFVCYRPLDCIPRLWKAQLLQDVFHETFLRLFLSGSHVLKSVCKILCSVPCVMRLHNTVQSHLMHRRVNCSKDKRAVVTAGCQFVISLSSCSAPKSL